MRPYRGSSFKWADYFRREGEVAHAARRAALPAARARALSEAVVLGPRVDRMDLLSRVGSPGAEDPVIVAAWRRLSQLEPTETPPLDSVHLLPLQSRDGHALCGTIFISSASSLYADAERGDLTGLAMLLHHEGVHVAHPAASELAVPGESLRFATTHGGSPPLLDLLLRSVRDERIREVTATP